jgi:hypothetical protein
MFGRPVFLLAAVVMLGPPGARPVPTRATLTIFVTSDCPVSNYYAPEVRQICGAYATRGVACMLVYEDVDLDETRMRRHGDEYGYRLPASIDRDRATARRLGATVTPQVVLTDDTGEVKYRGRIDNRYEAFGKPRRVVTERSLRDALEAVLAGRRVATPETPAIGCHIVFPDTDVRPTFTPGRRQPV